MKGEEPPKKPWSGRFDDPTDDFVEAFTASVGFDQRLYPHDIQGSIAHATMLAKAGVLASEERDAIVSGLKDIEADIDSGGFSTFMEFQGDHCCVHGIGRQGKIVWRRKQLLNIGGVDMITNATDARFALLGAREVGEETLNRFYILHCIAIPLAAAMLLAIHFWRVRKDGGISSPL